MSMDLQAFAQNEMQTALDAAKQKICRVYAHIFKTRQLELEKSSDQESARLFGLLSVVASMWLDADNADEPFQSTSSLQNINEEFIEILEGLLPHIHDPELEARIADILWLKRRDYRAAKQAISAYIGAARNLYDTEYWIVHSLERINRAIHIARRLNDQEGLQKATDYLAELLDKHKGDVSTEAFPIPFHLLSALQEQRRLSARAGEFSDLAGIGATTAEQFKNWHFAQQFLEMKAKWHQIEENDEQATQSLLAAVEIDVKRAQAAAAETPPRYLAAGLFIERAITALRRIGGQQDRVNELHKLLNQYGQQSLDQMEHVSIPIDLGDIPTRSIDQVAKRKLQDALLVWAHLADFRSIEDLRNEAKQNIAQSPFRFLVSSRTLNNLGKTVARQTSGDLESEEKVRDEMLRLATMHQDLVVAGIIGPALYQINLEHNIREQDLHFLVNHNPLVVPGHEKTYTRGLVAGLRDDGLVAAHLLLPQLENSLRQLLVLQGKMTSGLDNDLIQDEYPLSKIIYLRELMDILGPDMVFDLRALLVERSGTNLRNLVAHGLMSDEEFNAHRITYLTWITFKLLYLPFVRPHTIDTQTEEQPGPDEPE